MRKRSEVATEPTNAGKENDATEIPGPRITKGEDGIHYVACEECGLKKMSVGTAMKFDPPACIRCGAEIAFTPLQVAKHKPAGPLPGSAEENRAVNQRVADEDLPDDGQDRTSPRKASGKPSESPAAVTTPETPRAKAREQAREDAADVSDAGEKVSYTWAEEMYRVADFCNFRVGPFHAETTVRPGETRGDAFVRLSDEVDEQAKVAVAKKRDEYLKALLGVAKAVKRGVE